MTYMDKFTEEEIEQLVKESTSYKDFARKVGYSQNPSGDTIKNIKKRLEDYDTSHFENWRYNRVERTEDNVFVENSTASQRTLRAHYTKGDYSEYKCSICGMEPVWQGQPLTLILDHINGTGNDNRLENLRWVCPNCNQQLPTTGYKKMRSKKE